MTLAFVLAAGWAEAVEWKALNQATVEWEAVSANEAGDPLPAGDTVKYRVYLANAVTDPDKTNAVLLGETDQLEYILTLNTEGRFVVGVSAVRYDDAGTELEESAINWSDVNGEATPNPFGFEHYLKPAVPKNLR